MRRRTAPSRLKRSLNANSTGSLAYRRYRFSGDAIVGNVLLDGRRLPAQHQRRSAPPPAAPVAGAALPALPEPAGPLPAAPVAAGLPAGAGVGVGVWPGVCAGGVGTAGGLCAPAPGRLGGFCTSGFCPTGGRVGAGFNPGAGANSAAGWVAGFVVGAIARGAGARVGSTARQPGLLASTVRSRHAGFKSCGEASRWVLGCTCCTCANDDNARLIPNTNVRVLIFIGSSCSI